jgi:metal-responsive CopG/Arc/MetJ family transcriptional regulator
MSSEPIDLFPEQEGTGGKVKRIRNPQRTPTTLVRLMPADHVRFERLCRIDGKTRTEAMRDAVRFYLDSREQNLLQDRDARLEKVIKKGFERIAAMQARANIDIGVIYNMAWNNLPKEARTEIMKSAYNHSVTRLKQKLSKDEQEIKDLIGP